MSKPVIAVDIDDVLAANAAGFVRFSNERWGTNLTVDDYSEHWAEVWQVDMAEAERRATELHDSGVIGTYPHYPQAVAVLEHLRQRFSLVVTTSRRLSIQPETEAWLARNFLDVFDAVYFSGIYDSPVTAGSFRKTKTEILQQYGIRYLIDDQLKHCIPAAQAGIEALLYGEYSWNIHAKLPVHVTRCKDWRAVQEYFDAI